MQIFIQTQRTSLGICRDELIVLPVVLIGEDWSHVNWQGILTINWSHVCDSWNLRSPRLFKDVFSTRSQMASRAPCSNHRSLRSRTTTSSSLICSPDLWECSYSRVCLIFRGTEATMLVEASFQRLLTFVIS